MDDDGRAVVDARAALTAGRDVVLAVDPAAPVDVRTVGELAALVLLARRCGGRLLLEAPGTALHGLVDLLGLDVVLGLGHAPVQRACGSADPEG
ncbi:hypothetical protein [Motilibacter deserti]|uniref:STAS domain-containing protein n=1 Tax=Motilibacter deserti TaxID=2714956 RepID=A0ABX0GUM0_9ACTN|nr:hypothetical protein [Motilibacter deserti]NHC14599.1 hypothetical protein [Motilibacter deserti]